MVEDVFRRDFAKMLTQVHRLGLQIKNGDYPSWTLYAQIMTPDEAEKLWKEKKVNVVSGFAKSRSKSLEIT